MTLNKPQRAVLFITALVLALVAWRQHRAEPVQFLQGGDIARAAATGQSE